MVKISAEHVGEEVLDFSVVGEELPAQHSVVGVDEHTAHVERDGSQVGWRYYIRFASMMLRRNVRVRSL